jgi:methylenetetrahydrofolate dehydrogenase (NADP+)/methenyltetrahydrofolate cyclohydrolase
MPRDATADADPESRSAAGARLLDGKAIAAGVRADVTRRVAAHRERGRTVRLDAVLCSDVTDSAAHVYVQRQERSCQELGIEFRLHELPASSSQGEIIGLIQSLNATREVQAVMVQMPLPDGIDPYAVQSAIEPRKDVEGVNPANIGNIVYGRSSLAPCTALAIVRLIEEAGLKGEAIRGRRVLLVGASNIVGKPAAVMLMRPEATVISCNKHTADLPAFARTADVLVAAAGVPRLVTAEWVKPGAVVIDVGIHREPVDPPLADGTKMRTVGDVDAESVRPVAGWLSPVPGGVGPVTVAMLLSNVLDAAEATFQDVDGVVDDEDGG